MSKINREKFEAWFENDVVGAAVTFPEFEDGEYVEGELYDDQLYFMLQAMWMAWQAATKASEAQLTALTSHLESVVAENAAQDNFVAEMLSIAWQGGSVDGAEIQELALKHGLIRQEVYSADEHETLVDDPGNFEDGDPVYFRIETPATSAFLAEVRASELDSLAGVAETMLVKFSNQLCSSDMHDVVGWKMVLKQASSRASQLRQGGAV